MRSKSGACFWRAACAALISLLVARGEVLGRAHGEQPAATPGATVGSAPSRPCDPAPASPNPKHDPNHCPICYLTRTEVGAELFTPPAVAALAEHAVLVAPLPQAAPICPERRKPADPRAPPHV